MARPPAFWLRPPGILAWLLAPLGRIAAAITARRLARPGWRAPVPVICCGNVTTGGSGKTTLALDLGQRLAGRGISVHFLLRGYGGRVRGVHRVAGDDPVSLVGDEARLLAQVAPTWVSADREAGARAAVAAGAQAIVMDDGLQNPGLIKDLSLLVIDGGAGFGNGKVLPAGPLREPVAAGAARCQAAVLIGADTTGAAAALPPGMAVLRARLVAGAEAAALTGRRVLGFAGIGRPEKFFATLAELGAEVVGRRAFPDHHPFTAAELAAVLAEAARLDAVAVTTAKDAVRLPRELRARIHVVGVTLAWENAREIDAWLDRATGSQARTRSGRTLPRGPLELD